MLSFDFLATMTKVNLLLISATTCKHSINMVERVPFKICIS